MRILPILGMTVWAAAAPAAPQPQPPASKLDAVDVVGEFYKGDSAGLEERLSLRSDRTFRFRWREFGNLVDRGHGQVSGQWRLDGRRLLLDVDEKASDTIMGFPREYQVVPWGPRLYLVVETQMSEFCSDVNGGFEPGNSALGRQHFLRENDWKKPAPGKPQLDRAWMGCLLSRPVKARVTAVDHATVYLAAVHAEELKPGMTLYTTGRKPLRFLRLVSVSPSLVATSESGEVEAGEWVSTRGMDPDHWFHPDTTMLPIDSADAVQARIWADVGAGKPIVVHAVVALCDNKYQGIVPVSKALGDGQNPASNLYWGAGYGLVAYFTRQAGWDLVRQDDAPSPGVLQRIVLHRIVSRGGRDVPLFLVAEAWDGREIRKAIGRFLSLAAGDGEETLAVSQSAASVSLKSGGGAHAVIYLGHNGLMDFSLPAVPAARSSAPPRSSIVLACHSKAYFAGPLTYGGSHPLLLTTNLMAPEAYTLHAALLAWAAAHPSTDVREAAAAMYARFQKISLTAARRLFSG